MKANPLSWIQKVCAYKGEDSPFSGEASLSESRRVATIRAGRGAAGGADGRSQAPVRRSCLARAGCSLCGLTRARQAQPPVAGLFRASSVLKRHGLRILFSRSFPHARPNSSSQYSRRFYREVRAVLATSGIAVGSDGRPLGPGSTACCLRRPPRTAHTALCPGGARGRLHTPEAGRPGSRWVRVCASIASASRGWPRACLQWWPPLSCFTEETSLGAVAGAPPPHSTEGREGRGL